MVAAILEHYAAADAETRHAGRTWYPDTGRMARRMARQHGTTYRRAAAVIAALSPRIHWADNVAAADAVLAGRTPVRVLGASVRRAQACLHAPRPSAGLGNGPKVHAFYRAIVGDVDAVTVDAWAARAAGRPAPTTPAQYAVIADAYRAAAAETRENPRDLQAIVWCQIRGAAR